jgi:hypothetical protein
MSSHLRDIYGYGRMDLGNLFESQPKETVPFFLKSLPKPFTNGLEKVCTDF